jgi:hypothetical protein
MLDVTLEGKYKDLKVNVNKWLGYVKWSVIGAFAFMIIFAAWFAALAIDALLVEGTLSVVGTENIILFLAIFASPLAIAAIGQQKARVYEPEPDDLMLFFACEILDNLERYRKDKTPALKEEHRKKAISSSKRLLEVVEQSWVFGNFGLAKKVFGNAISCFQDHLSRGLVPNMKSRNEKVLTKAEDVVYQIAHFLLNPSVETLQHINELMDGLDHQKPKSGVIQKCSSFLRIYDIRKRAVVMVLIFAFAAIPSFLLVYFGFISLETGMIVFATIFGPLAAVYLSYILSQIEKREKVQQT